MNIQDKKYLEETFVIRNADSNGEYIPEFTELPNIKEVTVEALNEYFGEYEVKNSKQGSIVYKCTPVFIVKSETILEKIKNIK